MTDALTDAKAQSEQTTSDSPTTESTCPFCGDTYDNSFEERKHMSQPTVRGDAFICKEAWSASNKRTVYVHLTEGGI